jgi:hypothetical protein
MVHTRFSSDLLSDDCGLRSWLDRPNGAASHPGLRSLDRTGPRRFPDIGLRILSSSPRLVVLVRKKAQGKGRTIGGLSGEMSSKSPECGATLPNLERPPNAERRTPNVERVSCLRPLTFDVVRSLLRERRGASG